MAKRFCKGVQHPTVLFLMAFDNLNYYMATSDDCSELFGTGGGLEHCPTVVQLTHYIPAELQFLQVRNETSKV